MKNIWRKYKEYLWCNDNADSTYKNKGKKKNNIFSFEVMFSSKSKFFKYKWSYLIFEYIHDSNVRIINKWLFYEEENKQKV